MNDDVLIPEMPIVKFPPGRRAHQIGRMTIRGVSVILHTVCGLPITDAETVPENSWGIATCRDCATAIPEGAPS